jgi:hypothetical protein
MSWDGDGIAGYVDDYYHGFDGIIGEDSEEEDDEPTESDSVLRRNVIISELHASSLDNLSLASDLWTSFPTMASFRPVLENLLAALESNRSLETIHIGENILAIIGESDQGRLFGILGNLPSLEHMFVAGGSPGSPTVIHARVLTEALSQTSNGIKLLQISGFELSSHSEVEQLAAGLKNRAASLEMLLLEDIVLVGEDKTGFLDPILLALAPAPGEPHSQLINLHLSCRQAASNGLSIVSPEALGSFFACRGRIGQRPCGANLRNLGLNDNHCKVMAEQLTMAEQPAVDFALGRPSFALNLCGNPSIGQEGYRTLLGILNRKFNIAHVDVDDQNWTAKFNLVIYMNNVFNRGDFLKDGALPSKAMLVNFLAKLTTNSSRIEPDQLLNFIWYTLREDPSLIYN